MHPLAGFTVCAKWFLPVVGVWLGRSRQVLGPRVVRATGATSTQVRDGPQQLRAQANHEERYQPVLSGTSRYNAGFPNPEAGPCSSAPAIRHAIRNPSPDFARTRQSDEDAREKGMSVIRFQPSLFPLSYSIHLLLTPSAQPPYVLETLSRGIRIGRGVAGSAVCLLRDIGLRNSGCGWRRQICSAAQPGSEG